jgi:hypothetical protein
MLPHPCAGARPGGSAAVAGDRRIRLRQSIGSRFAEGYYLGDPLQSSNRDGRLHRFGFAGVPRLRRFGEGSVLLGGPVPRLRAWSALASSGAQHLTRSIIGFDAVPSSTVKSTLLRFDRIAGARDDLGFLFTGQIVNR